MTVIASSTFLTQLASPSWSGERYVNIGGVNVWFRVYRRNSPAVIFVFQGTIDRAVTPVPVYGTNLSDDIPNATIIGISDPALDVFPPPLGSGWYAGWEGVDLQAKLGAFFPQMIAALGATRVIFQGSSAGGFAALYYGHAITDSIVVALNPQTDLDKYDYTQKYRDACWNGYTGPLKDKIDCDLVTKYATTFDNYVVYIVNDGDLEHVEDHSDPFVDAIPRGKRWRLIDRKVYGRNDHVAIPEDIWVPWVAAAVNAPRANATDIKALMREW
jgi:hypothetical protein